MSKKDAFVEIKEIAKNNAFWAAFIIYSTGFILWNYYLSRFGFFEHNFIQTRFLAAGLLFWAPISLVGFLYISLKNKLPEKKIIHKILSGFSTCLLALWIFFLPKIFFSQIPQYLGGAKPIPISILGTPEQIDFLANYDVYSAENGQGRSSVQTYPLCMIYQSSEVTIFFNTSHKDNGYFSSRIISLQNESFEGIQSMMGEYPDDLCNRSKIFLYFKF